MLIYQHNKVHNTAIWQHRAPTHSLHLQRQGQIFCIAEEKAADVFNFSFIMLKTSNRIKFIELAVPFQTGLDTARRRKERCGHQLKRDGRHNAAGCSAQLIIVKVGMRGFIHPPGLSNSQCNSLTLEEGWLPKMSTLITQIFTSGRRLTIYILVPYDTIQPSPSSILCWVTVQWLWINSAITLMRCW